MLALIALLLALQEPAPSASPVATMTPPASPSAKPTAPTTGRDEEAPSLPTKGKRETVKGTFQAFDPERGTVSFLDVDGRTQVWPVDKALAAASSVRAQELSDRLKTGMAVVIRYVRDSGQPVVVYIGPEGTRREPDKR